MSQVVAPPSGERDQHRATDRAVDIHGCSILLWLLGWCLVLGVITDQLGLKYAQRFHWPSDLLAFEHAGIQDIDVAILGSSRIAFGLPSDAVRECLTHRLDRETRVVNLARMYATGFTMEALARDLLEGARKPKVLVLGLSPEAMDANNVQMASNVPFHARLSDIPRLLWSLRAWTDLVSMSQLLARGPENLAFYLVGGHHHSGRIRWMMLNHGGGQWCFSSPDCRQSNRHYHQREKKRWQLRQIDEVPFIAETRFSDFAIENGLNLESLNRLVQWARRSKVEIVLVDLPLHDLFEREIPPAVQQDYDRWLAEFAQANELSIAMGPWDQLSRDRDLYLDPDHLNPDGARRFTRLICRENLVPLLRTAR